ncbi:MAG: folate-binding protein [Pseudomonadota bacterium]
MAGERHHGRTVLAIGGGDRIEFLQGLVTNDVGRLKEGLVYAGLLTPQGKYLADFFLADNGDRILLDVAEPLAAPLAKRLRMYMLRADVTLEETDLVPLRGLGPRPEGAWDDPRHPDLGWRLYSDAAAPEHAPSDDGSWEALRVRLCVPETGIELVPNDTFVLEAGFERLNGVDFRKGCYVGQEVTARMKHKTQLRKGFVTVAVEGDAPPPGTDIVNGEKTAGALYTVADGQGIAYLRFDRAGADMVAGEARVSYTPAAAEG